MLASDLSWSQWLRILFISRTMNMPIEQAYRRYKDKTKDEPDVNGVLEEVYQEFLKTASTLG